MSESEKNPIPQPAADPGGSPRWYLAAAGAVVLAFVVALWVDRAQTGTASRPPASGPAPMAAPALSTPELPADHPPVGDGGQGGASPGMMAVNYDVNDVEQVWTRSCALCHGQDGRPTENGRSLGTPDLSDPATQSVLTHDGIERIIRQGRPPVMPPYGQKLPDKTIHDLIHKVESLKRTS